MIPEPSEERPSWLVGEEVPRTGPEQLVLGGTLESDRDAHVEVQPPPTALDRVGPIAMIGAAMLVGATLVVGGAFYLTMDSTPPSPYDHALQGPANNAGSVPVRKGVKKSTDRFGQ